MLRSFRSSRTAQGFLVLLIIAILIPLIGPIGSAYVLGVLTSAYYFGVFAMAWDLLFGYAGEVNFGPTFLIGLGAYGAALLNNMLGLPIIPCIIGGAVASLIGGFALALPGLRLRGPYFGLVTLVAVLLLQNVIVVFAHWTGGEIGMTVPSVLSISAHTNYWIALIFLVVCGLLLYGYARSPLGLILQAAGQDPTEAAALGFNVAKHKLAAFAVSALFSGVSGAMLIFYLGSASVDVVVDLAIAVQVIIAAVLGGRRTILGSIIGAVFLIVVGQFLLPLGQLSTFIVSLIALIVILIVPDGFLGQFLRVRTSERE